ncbi:TonB-dependent receptor [Rapidithrix thailandica]|uniref:TonB-dependent receptor n=1 Tax=Rapidithrix thailandica TaxID=413964 RepID=A0AAW9S4P7_9BACT
MSKRILISIICLLNFPFTGIAQFSDSLIWLKEVKVLGLPDEKKYSLGSQVQLLDSTTLARYASANLGDVLSQQSGLHLKQYGHGMTASATLRGTGSNHSAILWNGLNLNSLTLGQPDFSNIPVFLFDKLKIHLGGGSTLYGSGAIGGSILLNSEAQWHDGWQINLSQTIESFGTTFSGIKARYGNGSWEGKTVIYHKYSQNDFPFRNTTKYGKPSERQDNASYRNYGLLQEVSYRLSSRQSLSFKAWYNHSADEIQPIMADNRKPSTYTHLTDRSLRILSDYRLHNHLGIWQAMLAYVRDYQNYDDKSTIATSRGILKLQYEKTFETGFRMKAGIQGKRIFPEVEAYPENTVQNRIDVFLLNSYQFFPWWKAGFNLRQNFVSGYRSQFAPSIGNEWLLWKTSKRQLRLKANGSRSYRIPTFNDLYWQPGGNLDLKPESGYHLEGGLDYQYQTSGWRFHFGSVYFYSWVNDWILWIPVGSFHSPRNIKKVHSSGVELNGDVRYTLGHWRWNATTRYSMIQAINQKGLSHTDRSAKKQLPYTPRHKLVGSLTSHYKQWHFSLSGNYTGKQYTTPTNEGALPSYFLMDVNVGKSFQKDSFKGSVQVTVKNVGNVSYQAYDNYAMPGRYYQVQLNFHFFTSNK